jgi:hypothetical protein
MIDLTQIINQKIDFLLQQIKDTEKARDEAATPMESHSDQTRQNAEQLIYALKDEVKRQKLLLSKLDQYKAILYTVRSSAGLKDYLVVPDGLGGQSIDNVYLLAESTPLAKNLIGKKPGHTFPLNSSLNELVFIKNL